MIVAMPSTTSRTSEPADRLDFDHVSQVGADYSGRRLAALSVRGSRFERCRFDRVRAKGVAFSAGYDLSEYVDCSFDGVRFPSVIAGFSRFVRCSFRDADIKGFGDDYLELVDCVFTGKLRASVFWGAAPQPEAEKRYQSDLAFFAREGRPEPAGYRELARRPANEFHGNDFSGVELIDVSFRGIDLSRQRLPADGYLYLPEAATTVNRALGMTSDPKIEGFLRGTLGRALSFGQHQLLLREADYQGDEAAFALLREAAA
ncbi:MAG: hypothetical protein QOE53_1147 [Pseudonocardiales bacterium]|nr:hypothetical protein [Pseudonocardiales bacterium]